MDLELLAIWGFLLLIIIILIIWLTWFYHKERERYEDALEDLERQLRDGLISEETYRALRLDLEKKYTKKL